MPLWQQKVMDFYANNDLPNFNYVLFHCRRSKIVWPNEKEDIFVLISNDLLYGSLRFVKRSLYGSFQFRLSVLSDVEFSIQTYKMQLWGIFGPSKFAGRLVWDHLLTETGVLALHVFHGILKCMYWFPSHTKWRFPQKAPFNWLIVAWFVQNTDFVFCTDIDQNRTIYDHSKSVKQVCLLILAPAQDAVHA